MFTALIIILFGPIAITFLLFLYSAIHDARLGPNPSRREIYEKGWTPYDEDD